MKEGELGATKVSRRDFLKLGGIAAATGGVTTLGAGSLVGCATVDASIAEIEILYTCPIDGKQFASYEAMQEHFTTNHPEAVVPEVMTFAVNGTSMKVQVEPQWTLQETLQHALSLTGAKTMCDRGGCGSCTVLVNGVPALSCTILAIECEGKQIETVEGIAADEKWGPLFDAFASHDGSQCGYCSPGHIVVSKYLIEKFGEPTSEQIAQGLASNVCRCGTYQRHTPAIQEAAAAIKGGGGQ